MRKAGVLKPLETSCAMGERYLYIRGATECLRRAYEPFLLQADQHFNFSDGEEGSGSACMPSRACSLFGS